MGHILLDVLKKLELLKQERAIWVEVTDHLLKYVDDDIRSPGKAIVAEGCASQVVPQDMVQNFVNDIRKREVEPLEAKIISIETLQVEETGDGKGNEEEQAPRSKPIKPKGIHALAQKRKGGGQKTG